jgi:hypothetical protein
MMFITFLIFWLIICRGVSTISIGVIYNASLITSSSNLTISRQDCNECLCTMFTASILSLNCLITNINSVICQLFSDIIDLGLNSSQIKINSNSTFYYRGSAQSEITTVQPETTTAVSVIGGMLIVK